MTVIAGLVEGDRIFMGGDSASSNNDGDLVMRADQKVFRNGPFLIGFAGSWRMGQLLRYAFVPPKHPKRQDTYRFLVTTFIDAVRDCLRRGGFASKIHDVEEIDGVFLLGYRGRLFIVDADYQVAEAIDGFLAIGSGGQIAQGALSATQGVDPKKRVRQALEAAERYNTGVRRPFYVNVMDKEESSV